MAFPTSPSDGQVYGEHRWDATIGAWVRLPIASQTEAQNGSVGNALMTPERTTDTVGQNTEVDANTTHRGSDGKDHADVVLNNTHRGSDGKDHADVVLNNTHRGSAGTDHSDVGLNNTHRANNDQAHSDYLKNNADDITSGALTTTADKDSKTTGADGDYMRNIVLLEDGDADPTASNFPRGTLFIWYTP